jgi:PAS domain-containing protein
LHGVISLVKFPVFVGDEWWGAIGFDDCVATRDWSGEELAALRTAAPSWAPRPADSRRARRRAEAISDIERHVTAVSTWTSSTEGFRIESIGTQVEALLGYPHERFIADPTFWKSILHPDDRARIEASSMEPSEPGSGFEAEYRMIAADGAVVWIYDISRTFRRPRGAAEVGGLPRRHHLSATSRGTAHEERGTVPAPRGPLAGRDHGAYRWNDRVREQGRRPTPGGGVTVGARRLCR